MDALAFSPFSKIHKNIEIEANNRPTKVVILNGEFQNNNPQIDVTIRDRLINNVDIETGPFLTALIVPMFAKTKNNPNKKEYINTFRLNEKSIKYIIPHVIRTLVIKIKLYDHIIRIDSP